MQIGNYTLQNNLILAPMAGISDRPFRELCKKQGAGLAVSEMVASNPALRYHKRTLLKADHTGESGIRSVQILGTDPQQMAYWVFCKRLARRVRLKNCFRSLK